MLSSASAFGLSAWNTTVYLSASQPWLTQSQSQAYSLRLGLVVVDRPGDVVGGELAAVDRRHVVPLDALVQLERHRLAVRRDGPGVGHVRLDVDVVVVGAPELDQPAVDQARRDPQRPVDGLHHFQRLGVLPERGLQDAAALRRAGLLLPHQRHAIVDQVGLGRRRVAAAAGLGAAVGWAAPAAWAGACWVRRCCRGRGGRLCGGHRQRRRGQQHRLARLAAPDCPPAPAARGPAARRPGSAPPTRPPPEIRHAAQERAPGERSVAIQSRHRSSSLHRLARSAVAPFTRLPARRLGQASNPV